mmetsp:Transcript_118830/g.379093  ORF Transcript_118830/g.379093 Transcript_118830/m.379093 type:complete len:384 (+) Transcript_118830:1668-2819(+)
MLLTLRALRRAQRSQFASHRLELAVRRRHDSACAGACLDPDLLQLRGRPGLLAPRDLELLRQLRRSALLLREPRLQLVGLPPRHAGLIDPGSKFGTCGNSFSLALRFLLLQGLLKACHSSLRLLQLQPQLQSRDIERFRPPGLRLQRGHLPLKCLLATLGKPVLIGGLLLELLLAAPGLGLLQPHLPLRLRDPPLLGRDPDLELADALGDLGLDLLRHPQTQRLRLPRRKLALPLLQLLEFPALGLHLRPPVRLLPLLLVREAMALLLVSPTLQPQALVLLLQPPVLVGQVFMDVLQRRIVGLHALQGTHRASEVHLEFGHASNGPLVGVGGVHVVRHWTMHTSGGSCTPTTPQARASARVRATGPGRGRPAQGVRAGTTARC